MEIAQRELRSDVLIRAISDGDSVVRRRMTLESRHRVRVEQIEPREDETYGDEWGPSFWERIREVTG